MTAKSLLTIVALLLFVALASMGAVQAVQAGPAALTPTAEPPTFTPTATNTTEPTHTPLPTATLHPETETPTATPLHPTDTPTPTNTPSGTIPGPTATSTAVPTPTPGGTIPPPPDGSLMSVSAFCNEQDNNLPTWRIKNDSLFNMREPRNFWLLAGDGDDDSCAIDTVGVDPAGSFFLLAGQEITGRFRNIDFTQPQRICVQQSFGFPGRPFAAAVIGRDGNSCATALNPTGEPWGNPWIFFPYARK